MKNEAKIKINKFARATALALLFALIYTFSHASFEDVGIGARAVGMSNAFTADADDVYSVYYNPAGLVQLKYPEFSAYYGRLYLGLSDDSKLGNNFFAYGQPLRTSRKSFSGSTVNNPYEKTQDFGTLAVGYQQFSLDSLYKETMLSLSYARVFVPNVYLGMTMKNLGVQYGSNDYTENAINNTGRSRGGVDPVFSAGKNKRAMSYDLGMLYQFSKRTRFGALLANINQPDISLESTGDRVNMITKIGVNHEFRWGTINMDMVREKRLAASVDTDILVGYEWWKAFKRYGDVGLRCGGGIGSRKYERVSAGFSYRVGMVQLDYGMSIPLQGVQDTAGDHKVSMSFRFGEAVEDVQLGALLQEEEKLYMEAQEEMRKASEEKKRLEFEIDRMRAEIGGIKRGDLDAKERQLKQAKKALSEAEVKYKKAMDIAFRFYKTKALKSMNLKERVIILERIVEKYKNAGTDVTEIERELSRMRQEVKTNQNDYEMKVKYYKTMVQRGASIDQRKSILKKLIEQYSPNGVDVKELREELKRLGNGD